MTASCEAARRHLTLPGIADCFPARIIQHVGLVAAEEGAFKEALLIDLAYGAGSRADYPERPGATHSGRGTRIRSLNWS
jgi:hypothetical protein